MALKLLVMLFTLSLITCKTSENTTSETKNGGDNDLKEVVKSFKFLASADCQNENGNDQRELDSANTFQRMFSHMSDDSSIKGILVAGDLTQKLTERRI